MAFSIGIYYLGVNNTLSTEQIKAHIADAERDDEKDGANLETA